MPIIEIVSLFVATFLVLVLSIPKVTKTKNIVKIGNVFSKAKYDNDKHIFDINIEKVDRSWCVCIYVYQKSSPKNKHIKTHFIQNLLSNNKDKCDKKGEKIKKIIEN
jgi:hypothetical protein